LNDALRSLARYRLDRAAEALAEARLLLAEGHANTYVNRLYYACFYATSALLLLMDKGAVRHSGIRALLHQEIVKTGLVSATLGQLFDRLFDNRQKADYADLVKFDPVEVAPWLDESVEFVRSMEGLADIRMAADGDQRND